MAEPLRWYERPADPHEPAPLAVGEPEPLRLEEFTGEWERDALRRKVNGEGS